MPRKYAKKVPPPSDKYEREAAHNGAERIAGIDEAGRGPLAGPVVAAAVILSPERPVAGLADSKLLSPQAREQVFHRIVDNAEAIGIAMIPPRTIDQVNILGATRLAMLRAVQNIDHPPDYLLIDGPIRIDLDIPQRPIIKGDRVCQSISAAGIVAKVTRDRLMVELHEQYPVYGFDRHKGYGTKAHKDALAEHGPCPIHRLTFRGVKEFTVQTSSTMSQGGKRHTET